MSRPFNFRSTIAPAVLLAAALLPARLSAQDSFGFGFGDDASAPAASSPASVSVTGTAEASVLGYFDELDSAAKASDYSAGNLFSGSLGFSASASNSEASVGLELDPSSATPVSLGEAWVKTFWGRLDIEAGLKKLTWGKADSEGPLDAINPLDYSDLTIVDQMERKIARPLVHATFAAGSFTRVEGVFLPAFKPNSLAYSGRWAPAALSGFSGSMEAAATKAASSAVMSLVLSGALDPTDAAAVSALRGALETSLTESTADLEEEGIEYFLPDTDSLKYAQYGLRLTTTLGSQDLGFQYFSGNLREPSVSVDSANLFAINLQPTALATSTMTFNPEAVTVSYDRYHQLGADWAAVLAGFNARAEAAVNLTSDLSGDDGSVANPSFLWSVGFDRDLFARINLNAQGSGSVRLMHDKLGASPEDCEGGSEISSTRLITRLSRTFLRDEIEASFTGILGVEDADWLLMPELVWTRGDAAVSARAGFFGGDEEGNLGQYRDNGYATVSMRYNF